MNRVLEINKAIERVLAGFETGSPTTEQVDLIVANLRLYLAKAQSTYHPLMDW